MDIVIFIGSVNQRKFEEDRARELQESKRTGSYERLKVETYPQLVARTIKIFGWTALSLGFLIVILIIYTMVLLNSNSADGTYEPTTSDAQTRA